MRRKCLFGPIWSRRLGSSLGINLTPYKTCSLDCVYCECGITTTLTVERQEYILPEEVIEHLETYRRSPRFREHPPSYITFAGFGEPTLNSGLRRIIRFLKESFPEQRIALITNGTLFGLYPEIVGEIRGVNVLIPSLDAGTPEAFVTVNRPHPVLRFDQYLQGLITLRQHFQGAIWLEVFIVEGINDRVEEIELLQKHIEQIAPHRVHINSVDRPPAENWVRSPALPKLQKIAHALRGEVITVPPQSQIFCPPRSV